MRRAFLFLNLNTYLATTSLETLPQTAFSAPWFHAQEFQPRPLAPLKIASRSISSGRSPRGSGHLKVEQDSETFQLKCCIYTT